MTPPLSPMVSAARGRLVAIAFWARVVWIAARSYRGPVRVARVLARVRREVVRYRLGRASKYARVGGRYFWDLYAPGFPSLAFDRYVARELGRLLPFHASPPDIQTAIVAITKRCPLRCEHCFEWPALNRRETLTLEDLRRIVTGLQERGATQILLSGGEPLQRFEDALALVATARSGTDFWLLSSGHGLTAARADALRRSGLTGIALSLDHHDAPSHDRFRQLPGAYEHVARAARAAREAGLVVALSVCPSRAFVSVSNLQAYSALAEHLGAAFVQIMEPRPVGRYAGQDVALAPEQQRVLEEFTKRSNHGRDARRSPKVSYPEFTRRRAGCDGGGRRYVYVDTDGDLHPCPFCRRPAGNLVKGRLDDALRALRTGGCPADAALATPGGGSATRAIRTA